MSIRSYWGAALSQLAPAYDALKLSVKNSRFVQMVGKAVASNFTGFECYTRTNAYCIAENKALGRTVWVPAATYQNEAGVPDVETTAGRLRAKGVDPETARHAGLLARTSMGAVNLETGEFKDLTKQTAVARAMQWLGAIPNVIEARGQTPAITRLRGQYGGDRANAVIAREASALAGSGVSEADVALAIEEFDRLASTAAAKVAITVPAPVAAISGATPEVA